MAETLTFANYSPVQHGLESIYGIGADDNHPGVAQGMAAAFNYELSSTPDVDNLGGLITVAGRSKELQENIASVRSRLGTDQDPVDITRGWAERSGLLTPVERTFMTGEAIPVPDIAVITGGVRNWMQRRQERAKQLSEGFGVKKALLVAGNRAMKTSEGPDVVEGMIESDYLDEVVADELGRVGIRTEVVLVGSGKGSEVMQAAAAKATEMLAVENDRRTRMPSRGPAITPDNANIVVVSNAAAWVQNGGQFLRAMRQLHPSFNADGRQLSVVSDPFELGTGTEPTATHQNPLTAAGQIARNLHELAQHAASL